MRLYITLLKMMFLTMRCQAPNPRRRQVSLPELHEFLPPHTFGYCTPLDSQAICEIVVHNFALKNFAICRELRHSIGEINEYQVDVKNTVFSYGARLCTDPEAGVDDENCHGTTFCKVISNYSECPMSILQQYLDHVRFRFYCNDPGQRAFLYGEQPDTIARCQRPSEKDRADKMRALAEETRNMEVYVADQGLYMLKKAPWSPSTSCIDAARSKLKAGSPEPPS